MKGKNSDSNDMNDMTGGKDKKDMNDSQRHPKGRVDFMKYMFSLFFKISKILTRGIIKVVGIDTKLKIYMNPGQPTTTQLKLGQQRQHKDKNDG